MIFVNAGFGNSSQGLGCGGRALGAEGQLCSAGLTSLSEPALCPNPWPAWATGIVTAASSHCVPVEMPAGAVIFHFITMSLMFSRHLSCCPCLLFGCIPPLCWSGGYLRLILFGARACSPLSSCCCDAWLPAWQTVLQVGTGRGVLPSNNTRM